MDGGGGEAGNGDGGGGEAGDGDCGGEQRNQLSLPNWYAASSSHRRCAPSRTDLLLRPNIAGEHHRVVLCTVTALLLCLRLLTRGRLTRTRRRTAAMKQGRPGDWGRRSSRPPPPFGSSPVPGLLALRITAGSQTPPRCGSPPHPQQQAWSWSGASSPLLKSVRNPGGDLPRVPRLPRPA